MKTRNFAVVATTGLLALTIGCATPAIASAAVAAPAAATSTSASPQKLKSTIANRVTVMGNVSVNSASTPVAVDSKGNVFYGATNGDDVMRVTPAGVKSTLDIDPTVSGTTFQSVRGVMVNSGTGAVQAIVNLKMSAGVYQDWVFQLNTKQDEFTQLQPFAQYGQGQMTAYPDSAINPITGAMSYISGNQILSFVPTRTDTMATPTVIAGTSTAGFSGDGGQATAAQFDQPQGLSYDSKGNLYVADTGNNRVRQISANGVVSTIGGTGIAGYNGDGVTGTAANLSAPTGVATDAAGNVYIADSGNNRVRVLDNYRTIATVVGSGSTGTLVSGSTAPTANLNSPQWVGVTGNGSVVFNSNATPSATVPKTYVAGPLPSLSLTTSSLPASITPANTSGYLKRRSGGVGSPASFNVISSLNLTPSTDGTTYNSSGPVTFTTQTATGSPVTITAQSVSYTATNPVEFSNLLLLNNVTFSHAVNGITYTSTIPNLSFAYQQADGGSMKYIATTPPVPHAWGDLDIPDLKAANGTVAPDNANVAGEWIMQIDLTVTPNYSPAS